MDLIEELGKQLKAFHIDVFRGELSATARGFFNANRPAPTLPRNAALIIAAFNDAFADWRHESTEWAAHNLRDPRVAARFPLVCCSGEGARCFFVYRHQIYAMSMLREDIPRFAEDDANPIDRLEDVWLGAPTTLGIHFLVSVVRTFGPDSRHARFLQERVGELIWEDLPEIDSSAGGIL